MESVSCVLKKKLVKRNLKAKKAVIRANYLTN